MAGRKGKSHLSVVSASAAFIIFIWVTTLKKDWAEISGIDFDEIGQCYGDTNRRKVNTQHLVPLEASYFACHPKLDCQWNQHGYDKKLNVCSQLQKRKSVFLFHLVQKWPEKQFTRNSLPIVQLIVGQIGEKFTVL